MTDWTWLYKLQQRLAITRQEARALLVLTVLFAMGATAQHVQRQQAILLPAPAPADTTRSPLRLAPERATAPVNINTASVEELQALSGIGPVLARRVATYRAQHRPFQNAGELRRVRGIGPKTLEALRPHITVDSTAALATASRPASQ